VVIGNGIIACVVARCKSVFVRDVRGSSTYLSAREVLVWVSAGLTGGSRRGR
jgi:hypothetical protein